MGEGKRRHLLVCCIVYSTQNSREQGCESLEFLKLIPVQKAPRESTVTELMACTIFSFQPMETEQDVGFFHLRDEKYGEPVLPGLKCVNLNHTTSQGVHI